MSMSIEEAGQRLNLHPGRVRRLVAQGLLEGRKIGGRWLVDEAAIQSRLEADRRPGRPLTARSAWGLLWAADGLALPCLAPRERARARERARSWPPSDWPSACQHRAVTHRVRAHPSVILSMQDDPRAVRSGASVRQLSVDLLAPGDAECYVREPDLAAVIDEYALIPSSQPNVVLRAPPAELWLFDGVEAPWPVVVVDLLDARDDRSVRAALDLARRMQAT